MKVVHLVGSWGIGGIQRLVGDLVACQVANPGLKPEIVVFTITAEDKQRLEEAGVTVHHVNITGGFDFSPGKMIRIFKIFRQVDIIHYHGFALSLSVLGIASGKKRMYTEHGNFGFGRKWRWRDTVNHRLKAVFLRRGVDYITFNSCFTRGYAEKRYQLEDSPREVLYNGIRLTHGTNPGRIDKSVAERIAGNFVVGTTSRFAGVKRIDRLIRAFARFHENKKAVLLLVGDGPLRYEYEDLADRLGVRQNTVFTGYRDNVRDYQYRMDVCVFPSQNEPFGLVAVETLSIGKPTIVCKDGGGIVEILSGISPQDVVENQADLINRLSYYYNHPQEISIHRKDRKRYSKRFDIVQMADRFFEIYREL